MQEIICKISLRAQHKIENGSWHKVDQSPHPQAKKNALIHHKNGCCASHSGLNSFSLLAGFQLILHMVHTTLALDSNF